MESNGQTEVTCKIEIDSQIGSRLTALDQAGLSGGRIKQKGKELVDTNNSVGGGESGWRWKRVTLTIYHLPLTICHWINGNSKNTSERNLKINKIK